MDADDEMNVTDIELLPDGRVLVFGMSLEVLHVLDRLQCGADDRVRERMNAERPSGGMETVSRAANSTGPRK
jgi:hypothetical protein